MRAVGSHRDGEAAPGGGSGECGAEISWEEMAGDVLSHGMFQS